MVPHVNEARCWHNLEVQLFCLMLVITGQSPDGKLMLASITGRVSQLRYIAQQDSNVLLV
jgi:hypothetical protein